MTPRQSRLTLPAATLPSSAKFNTQTESDVLAVVEPSDTLSLSIKTASLHELLEMRRIATKHSTDIRTLRITIGSFSVNERWIELSSSLQYIDYRPINWDALLALLPGVRRLDLSEMPLTTLHVQRIVEAASRCCVVLEALVLPTTVTKRGVKDEVEPLLRVLSEAMEKWGVKGEHPGLCELTVPCYARRYQKFPTGELLRDVLAECPRLMVLDVALWHTPVLYDVDEGRDTVDDDFCEFLTKSCSRLARFTLRDVFVCRPAATTRRLTDDGLMALGRLAVLTDLQLRSANFTGLRLFDFLSGLPSERWCSRLFQITIGGRESTERLLEAFRALLKHLETTSRANFRLATSDFLLRVNNGNLKIMNEAWSRQYLSMIEPLVARVKAKHPSLRIRLTMTGLYEDKFDQACHFWLYTSHSTRRPPERDWSWGFDSDPHNSFANIGGRKRTSLGDGGICG